MSACFNQFNGFIVLIMLSTLTYLITKVFINYNSYNAKWYFFKESFFLITEYLNIRYLIMFFLYIIIYDKKNYKKKIIINQL